MKWIIQKKPLIKETHTHAHERRKKGEKWWQKSEKRPLSQKIYFLKSKI